MLKVKSPRRWTVRLNQGLAVTAGSPTVPAACPEVPMVASGTRGMKAALNRAPSPSILDGRSIKGHFEGVTGSSIGKSAEATADGTDGLKDAESLYQKLERQVVPLYHGGRERWIDVTAHAIALNGSFVHTHRMVQPYVLNA